MAHLVADHAGEMAAKRRLGDVERSAVLRDGAHGVGDDVPFVQPAEAGLRPPGLAAHQRRMRHIDADRYVMHCLCGETQKR